MVFSDEMKNPPEKKANRLIGEKSPYLLQHAYNPVDWYPWGDDAFKRAREEDKPIFLSVGYSTCYWCHVMEREVFENDTIAVLMNKYFVSVKVDREERPDVDRVYMAALQVMTKSGGWPMSMFLNHDLEPFYGATYIGPVTQYGRVGFPELLAAIQQAWTNERENILGVSKRVGEFLAQLSVSSGKEVTPGPDVLDMGFEQFSKSFDAVNGGFSRAPKFPQPVSLNFLLRYFGRTGNKKSLDMALETLKRMSEGGIYDHIGGGFHRYSTDERWHVPHFEKMLYDQAQLASVCVDAYQITHDRFFECMVREILAYVLREMTHREGGFFSAQDAESTVDFSKAAEKEEGAFYTWSKEEVDGVLDPNESKVFCYCFGVRPEGNVPAGPRGEFFGENILYRARSVPEAASHAGLSENETQAALGRARDKLFKKRQERPKPHTDDKILVSWNGLMISAFARAHQALGDKSYLDAAVNSANFILKRLYDPGHKNLLRRFREGDARLEAHLEDFAFFAQGLLDLYEASLDFNWMRMAIELTQTQIEKFYDTKAGAFYDISGSDKSIIVRTKEWADGAEPSGNSVAIMNLLRLSQATDKIQWRKMAERSIAHFGGRILESPRSAAQMLVAIESSISKHKQIIIAGAPRDPLTRAMVSEVHCRYIPNKIILLADGGEGQKYLGHYNTYLQTVRMSGGKSTAYICENFTCNLPATSILEVRRILDEK